MTRAWIFPLLVWIHLQPLYAAHPSLIMDATDVARLTSADAAVAAWRVSALKAAQQALEATLEIPAQGAGWFHDYFCPDHGRQLVPLSPNQHRCPADGRIFSGGNYDAAWRYFVQAENCRRVRDMGVGYAVSGNVAYASRVRDYLLALADRYPGWPLHGRRSGPAPLDGARMFSQTLDEAVHGLALLQGYDLTFASPVYSASDRERIQDRLFRELIRTIRRPRPGPSNWHSWHNAYLLCAGYVLDDATLVRQTLDGPWGVRDQLRQCVDGDGFWFEGSIGYHFYALTALVDSVEAAYRHGVDLWSDPKLVAMFSAPLLLAWPDGRFPALNDSAPESLADFADLYRIAYFRTGKEEFRYPFFRHPSNRLESVLYPDRGPRLKEVLLQYRSQLLRNTGLALLRNPGIPQDVALLKFGPHGGGHGHFDKLELALYCAGQERLPDPGTVRYGVPSYTTWYKRTLAHNTLVVDGHTQAGTSGRSLGFGETPAGTWARAGCDTAYSGVAMDRTVLLGPDFVVDVFRVQGDEPHVYDLAYHLAGALSLNVAAAPAVIALASDASPAYAHLAGVRAASGDAPWKAEVVDGTRVLRLWGAGDAQQIFFADAPGYQPDQPVPMALIRREAASTIFVHVLDWSAQGLPWDHTLKDGDVTVRLQPPGARGRYVITFPADPTRPVEAMRP